jgi:hypothetical protein
MKRAIEKQQDAHSSNVGELSKESLLASTESISFESLFIMALVIRALVTTAVVAVLRSNTLRGSLALKPVLSLLLAILRLFMPQYSLEASV